MNRNEEIVSTVNMLFHADFPALYKAEDKKEIAELKESCSQKIDKLERLQFEDTENLKEYFLGLKLLKLKHFYNMVRV